MAPCSITILANCSDKDLFTQHNQNDLLQHDTFTNNAAWNTLSWRGQQRREPTVTVWQTWKRREGVDAAMATTGAVDLGSLRCSPTDCLPNLPNHIS